MQRGTTPSGVIGLFGFGAGLCAIFALVVTVAEGRAPRMASNLALTFGFTAACVALIALARFVAARETPDAGTRELSPRGRIVVGALCSAMGILFLGIGSYSAAHAGRALGSEDFVYVPAALIFVFCGILIALPPREDPLHRLIGALLLTSFALTFDWVAFGPGERHFSGGVSLGFLGIRSNPGETLGRAAFGVGAVLMDIWAIALWVKVIRSYFAAKQ